MLSDLGHTRGPQRTVPGGSQRHPDGSGTLVGLEGEHLVYVQLIPGEAHRRAGQIKTPDSCLSLRGEGNDFVPVPLEVGRSTAGGRDVMVTQALHVAYIEARLVHG